jgi:hypothetical protein
LENLEYEQNRLNHEKNKILMHINSS